MIRPHEKVVENVEVVDQPEETPTVKEQVYIGELLRRVVPQEYVDIYSSDKSTFSAHVYGGDVLEYASLISQVSNALLTDSSFDHDRLLEKRANMYVRDIFVGSDMKVIDPIAGIMELKKQAIRLSDGLELRDLKPSLGIHTYQNSLTAHMLLRDLDEFFKESSLVYQEYRTLRGGNVYFRKPG